MSKELNKKIGARIRRQRELLGLTREELCNFVEVSPQFLSEIERGVKGVSVEMLYNLCQGLGASADFVLMGRGRGERSQKIDFQTFFREIAFSSASWQPDGPNSRTPHYERAKINFQIVIEGIDYGVHPLRVSFNTDRASKTWKQHNGVTHLMWGATIVKLVAQEDLLGGTMYLYAPRQGVDFYTLEFEEK